MPIPIRIKPQMPTNVVPGTNTISATSKIMPKASSDIMVIHSIFFQSLELLKDRKFYGKPSF
jgi:hypothetical protein